MQFLIFLSSESYNLIILLNDLEIGVVLLALSVFVKHWFDGRHLGEGLLGEFFHFRQ